ncbi:hypothetical protein JCM3766R1_002531 [Sporobolomyces carnicolor]
MVGASERRYMVFEGDPDIGNEVNAVNFDALENALRPTASTSNATPQPFPPSNLIEIVSVSLHFSPPPSRERDELFEALGGLARTIPVSFTFAKERAKTPHVIYITSHESSELVEIAALDPTCRLAQKWSEAHTPPPLTKAGQKFKNVKSAAAQRAKLRGGQVQVPKVGGGGLLDALVILDSQPTSGLSLKGELAIEDEAIKLDLQACVEPVEFFPLAFSRAKQLVLERLFPRARSPPSDIPDESTIDWFYRSLRRAPITREGVPTKLKDPRGRFAETQEERDVRLRREAKGKGRAIEEAGDDDEVRFEVEEDVLLRPRGLKVELFPFQSRSLRWMLAREGKVAKVIPRYLDEEFEGSETGEDGEELQRIRLEALEETLMADMARGPFWERLEFEAGGRIGMASIWLNRLTGRISSQDPVENLAQGNGNKELNEAERDGVEGHVGSGEDAGTGGFEGHGLLADEVGTGKTVTVVALVLLHPDPLRCSLPAYNNPQTDARVQPTGLTLVVCPTSISQQWMQELARLAPSVRVLRYEGIKTLKATFTPAYVAGSFDLVLTTFDVLRKEINVARKPYVRALRNHVNRTPRYRRSLLIEIDWMRVVADETQMVGDAFSATSETLSLIPRKYSWAVTSTPLRDKIEDVRPLLTYLRVEPIASSKNSLARLLEEPDCFRRLFEEIGERTLKSQVHNELYLPKQTRSVVPLDFSAIERFYYDSRYSEMLQALGLNADGTPHHLVDRRSGQVLPWKPDKAEMNRWLGILRALAAHPQVGAAGRQALGHVLKTVEEVYKSMREQAISAIQSEQRAILANQVKRGQYSMWDKDIDDRFSSALKLFEVVIEKVDPIIEEVAQEIHAAWKERRKSRSETSMSPEEHDVTGALQIGFANDEGRDKESLTERERAFARSLSGLKNRLRDLLFVKHSALFFSGHAYFNMQDAEKETEAYGSAERLRQTLLQSYENNVESAQTKLQTALEERDAEDTLEVTDLELPFNEQGHGVVALTVYEDIEITSDILNGYAELVFQYRQMIIDMILKTVSIAGDNATGDEYEERAVLQEQLEVYIEAYTVLVGEWCYGILGVRSTLADQFKAQQSAIFFVEENLLLPSPGRVNSRKRSAKTAQLDGSDEEYGDDRMERRDDGSKAGTDPTRKIRSQKKRNANIKHNSIRDFRAPTLDTGFAPADILRYELLVERIEAKGDGREFSEITPLRHLLKKLKDAAELSNREEEFVLLEHERKRISKALGSLEKVADRLRNELSSFSTAFNARVLYFKNLQSISDSVADPPMESSKWRGLLMELEDLRLKEKDLADQLDEKLKRKRFLDNLSAANDDEDHTCPICADTFNEGVLLACVHLICRSCFKNWYARSKTCPLCKAKIQDRSWQSVKYRHKGKKNDVSEHENNGQSNDAGDGDDEDDVNPADDLMETLEGSPPALHELSEAEIDDIDSIETTEPLSRKSDFVVKLTKYLRRRDPECKIVIFSVWQEALQLLMEAFSRNGLVFVRLEGSSARGKREGVVKRFKEDPDVAAFFLHTRSESAGLTLTCARYMILLEPLLAPQLEIQATARIWRIGQTQETRVFQLMVNDTTDERVAELRARSGTSLFIAQGSHDAGRESLLGQQQGLASKEARSKTKSEASAEALDDEDDIARCLLSPQHYIALQKALLPQFFRNGRLPPLPEADADAGGDARDHEMAPAGIAAVGRAALDVGG